MKQQKQTRPTLKLVQSTNFGFLDGFKDTWNKATAVPYHFKNIPQELSGSLQENILTLVCMSDRCCRNVQLNVPLELFSNQAMRLIAREAYGYVEAFGKAPREHLPDLMEQVLNGKEDIAPTVMHIVGSTLDAIKRGFNEGFVAQQLFHFVELQQLKITVAALYKAAETENLVEARKAIYESPMRIGAAMGIGAVTVTVKDVLPALLSGDNRKETLFPLNIEPLDRYQLSPQRKELFMFMAPPKKGKSWWLIYLAKQALMARLKVLYITLEMSSEKILHRIIQSVFALGTMDNNAIEIPIFRLDGDKVIALDKRTTSCAGLHDVKGRHKLRRAFGLNDGRESLAARLTDNLRVVEFPTATLQMQDLDGYLEHLELTDGFTPDLLCLDYMDLMQVNTGPHMQNYRLGLSNLAQTLRGLAVRKNFALATASQTNRSAMNPRVTTITEQHAAEDITKVAIADAVISHNQTASEKRAGVARLFVVVARGAPDKFTVNITQSYATGQFCLDSNVINSDTYFSMFPQDEGGDDAWHRSRDNATEE